MALRTFRELYPNPEQWVDPLWLEQYGDLSEGYDEQDGDINGCQATNGQFVCTRPYNHHEGPHVADDGCEVLAVWD